MSETIDDGVGAQAGGDGLDEVDAGLGDVERDAAHLGVAVIGQQLAPRGDQLIGVEQRHLRERCLTLQLHALRDLVADRRGAAGLRGTRG